MFSRPSHTTCPVTKSWQLCGHIPTGSIITGSTRKAVYVMCGRITQKSDLARLGLGLRIAMPVETAQAPRYNGAPGQDHWVIRQHPKTGERHLDRLWWGLIPYWVTEPSPKHKPINATAERVATAPMFRAA